MGLFPVPTLVVEDAIDRRRDTKEPLARAVVWALADWVRLGEQGYVRNSSMTLYSSSVSSTWSDAGYRGYMRMNSSSG
jgi:hypothetical protein